MQGVQNYNKTESKHIVEEIKVNYETILQNKRRRLSAPNPPPPPPPITNDL